MLRNNDLAPVIRTGTGSPEADLLLAVYDKAVKDAQFQFEGNYPFTPSSAYTERLLEAQAGLELEIAKDGERFVKEINVATRFDIELSPDGMAPHILRAISRRMNE